MAEQRLIDANALIEHLNNNFYGDVIEEIKKFPTASPNEIPVAKIEFNREQMKEIVNQALNKVIDNGTLETKACKDCKYVLLDPYEEPCRCCCYGDGLDNWEAADGTT